MVILNKIYTKTGDGGDTALGTGKRVPKHHLRIEAYGTTDEANAAIGVARLCIAADWPDVAAMLLSIQNDLFDLGADLCTPESNEPLEYEPLRIIEAQVARVEAEIDLLNGALTPLRSFVLPGGTEGAALLHVARTVTRRAERAMVALSDQENEQVSQHALKYINRLSDFLFVASRYVNGKGSGDLLWVPGKNRDSKV